MHPHAASLAGCVAAVAVPSVKMCWTPADGWEVKQLVVSERRSNALFQAAANDDLGGI